MFCYVLGDQVEDGGCDQDLELMSDAGFQQEDVIAVTVAHTIN